jgi:ribose transport system substrate-binding protein
MKRKYVLQLVALVLSLIMLVALTACAPAAEEAVEGRELTIGIVTLQMRAPYFIGMVRAIEAAAAEYGNIRTIVADAEGDVAAVDAAIEDLIAQRVDGLIMNISPIETLPGPMEAINEAGIPVVLVNRRFLGTGYDSWVGVDNLNTGAGVGAVIAETMGGRGTLLMIRGGPEDNTIGNARRDGVLSQVEPTDIEVIFAPEFGGWNEDGGFSLMEDMLAKHPNIDAVFAENDSMALGALRAIQDAGRADEIKIFGFDGQRAALQLIKEGTNFIATGLNSPTLIGQMGFNHLMAVIAGAERVNIDTVFPVTVITEENVEQYFNPESVF